MNRLIVVPVVALASIGAAVVGLTAYIVVSDARAEARRRGWVS